MLAVRCGRPPIIGRGMNSQAVAFLVVLGCLLLAGILTTQQRALDFGGPLRLWLWRREGERMTRRSRYPGTVKRAFWSEREYQRDLPRLLALGYRVASETNAKPYEELPMMW